MFWNKNKKDKKENKRFDEIPENSVVFENKDLPQVKDPNSIPIPDEIVMPDEALFKTPNTEDSVVFPESEQKAPIKELSSFEKKVDSNNIDNFEEEISVLKNTNSKLSEENVKLKNQLKTYKNKTEKLQISINKLKEENAKLKQSITNQESNDKVIYSSELDKAKLINQKYVDLAKTYEELKAKIRYDIRKIRMREKELSNRIELIKQDRDTLITAKDQKILKLKKQIDDIEFQKEALNEINEKLRKESKENIDKAERVIKALRLSTSLLESDEK